MCKKNFKETVVANNLLRLYLILSCYEKNASYDYGIVEFFYVI